VESRVTKAPELLERDNTIAEPIETKSSFTTRPAYENTSIPATTKPESAGKRSAFKELALRAFPLQIPFPLSESAVFKRKKGSLNVWSRAGITQTEPWSIAIKTISITGLGLHAATPKDGFNLVFDVKTQSILIYYKGKSLAEFYSRCQLDPTSFRNAYRLTRGRETRFEMIGDNNQSAVCEIEFHSVADYDDFVKKIKRMAFPSLREDILNKCVA